MSKLSVGKPLVSGQTNLSVCEAVSCGSRGLGDWCFGRGFALDCLCNEEVTGSRVFVDTVE